MNTSTTRNQTKGRSQQARPERAPMQPINLDGIRTRIEDHVKDNPMKAVGQAVAIGYVLRFLPIRALLATGLRLAAPILLLNRVLQSQSEPKSEE